MEKNVSKVVTIGSFVALSLFVLQTQASRIKSLYFPNQEVLSESKKVVQVEGVKESTQSVSIPQLKTMVITEEDINVLIAESESELSQDVNENVSITIQLLENKVKIAIEGGDSLTLTAVLGVTQDKKALEVLSYKLAGFESYDEAVKKEVVNTFSGFVLDHIKSKIGGSEIESLAITESSIIVGYYQ